MFTKHRTRVPPCRGFLLLHVVDEEDLRQRKTGFPGFPQPVIDHDDYLDTIKTIIARGGCILMSSKI